MSRKWIKFQYYFAMAWLIRRIPSRRYRWKASGWLFRDVKIVVVDRIDHIIMEEEAIDSDGDVVGHWLTGYWHDELPYPVEK